MKDYKTLEELNELIEKELKNMVQKGSLTPGELESAEKAVCLMEKIIRLEDGSYNEGYSGRRMSGHYYDGESYMNDGSYARGRNPYTGRYVSRDQSYYNTQMSGGYSGHSIADRSIEKLERMMDETDSDYERELLRRFIKAVRTEEMK